MTWLIDASVVIAALMPDESTADHALSFLAEQEPLTASDLIDAEITNALSRNVRRGRLTADEALLHHAWWLDRGAILRGSRPLLSEALTYACSGFGHPYDLVQLLTARAYSAQLVTLDSKLIERVQNSELTRWVVHLTQI
jgi:predicted nucleic acid-binding protein